MHTLVHPIRGLRFAVAVLVIALVAGLVVATPARSAAAAEATPTATWHGEYFDNPSLSGTPVLVREDPTVDFDWGSASPEPSMPADNFSIRWTRSLDFAAGTWRFSTATDDGVRLYVDGQLVIDHWVDQGTTQWTADVQLTAGTHMVVMEFYDGRWDAVARLAYGQVDTSIPTDSWKGEYFPNQDLTGRPVMVRADSSINFDWGMDGPSSGLPVDGFSVRWSKTLSLSAANYKFATTTDDGVRLYVDGTLVIDHWTAQAAGYYETTLPLAAGDHTVVMEYFEQYGDSVARLSFAEDPATDGTTHINAGGSSYLDSFGNQWSATSRYGAAKDRQGRRPEPTRRALTTTPPPTRGSPSPTSSLRGTARVGPPSATRCTCPRAARRPAAR
jgi:hypothetical protein